MSTMTDDGNDEKPGIAMSAPALGDTSGLLRCARCQLRYLPAKSTSALRLTYCSFLCELGDLGFSMTGLEHMQRAPKAETPSTDVAPPPEPVGAS